MNFFISLKNFEKNFFAWNVLKHKVKPKNSRNSTFFSKKPKISPLFLKNTCKIFKSKEGALTFSHGNRLFFGWWLKADKKPPESWRLKSRLSVSAIPVPICCFHVYGLHWKAWSSLTNIPHLLDTADSLLLSKKW